MITGGTGSFGQAVLDRFLATDVEEIRIYSRDEKKQEEMRLKYKNNKLSFHLGDVRSYESLMHSTKGVDYIFHAAALKQVPSCEFYPMEAVRTNILGTENIMNAATANGVKRLIILSTDKAVYPINAMGISKAMAEKLMTAKARSQRYNETILCATRYGNVMASRGSVIPLFISQIYNGKSITVTDPNMTRFLMSLEESVNLVLHAFQHGQQGDIFVQKSPSATVGDLAQSIKEIFNPTTLINIIGTRHGEKLYESLISREEMAKAVDMGNYYRIPSDNRSLNYDQYFSEGEATLSEMNDYTSHNTKRLTIAEIKNILLDLDYIKGKLSD